MITPSPAATMEAATAPLGPEQVFAWCERYPDTWDALVRAWQAGGGRGLALLPPETSPAQRGLAAAVATDGETVAWLVGEAADAAQGLWLRGVATLIGDAVARDTELDAMTDELVDTYDQLTFLYETAQTFSVADTLSDALRQVVGQARRIAGAEGAVLTVARRGVPPLVFADGAVPDAATVASAHDAAIRENQALVANSAGAVREIIGTPARVVGHECDISEMIIAPIKTTEGATTATCFGTTRPTGFTAGTRRLMQAVVEQCIGIVARFALQEEQIRQSRLARDLELAAQMQTALLPAPLSRTPGVALAVRILPANEVGGDFYIHPDRDESSQDENAFVIGIGDVAGKGITAAMAVTLCLSALRAEVRHFVSPAIALRSVSSFIEGELERVGTFATCMVVAYDRAAQTLCYANAGHTPALHWHARTGAITELRATGLPLGVDVGIAIEDMEVRFLPDDVLVLCTDGVTEAMDADGQQFGDERLHAVFAATATGTPAAIESAVIAAVRAFAPTQRDDITVMVLKAGATSE